jgi:O-antigen/teichoic acid export membrane protein
MAMMTARGDRDGALRVFQSCWWLITSVCTAFIVLLGLACYFLPAAHFLRLHEMGESNTKWILFFLGCAVLLAQLESLLQSAYRCIGRYPFGSFIKSILSMTAYGMMLIPVALGGGARLTALVFASANVFFTLVLCIMVRRDIPWIRFGWSHVSFTEVRRLSGPAFAFLAFPIGNALNLQGTLMAVGYALGPTSVVIFGTARTVSRVAYQIIQMVSSTFWPEMSAAFGTNNLALTRTLHRRACQMALAIGVLMIGGMMTLGPWFLHHWTGGHVPPSRSLLSILLLVVVANSLWSTSSTLLAAINRHQGLAVRYLFATSITVILTFFLAKQYGLYSAAASLLISEGVMNMYVLPASLSLSEDSLPGFLASLLHYPPSLRPQALLERIPSLRQSRQG